MQNKISSQRGTKPHALLGLRINSTRRGKKTKLTRYAQTFFFTTEDTENTKENKKQKKKKD